MELKESEKNVAVYCRVSTTEQNLQQQIDNLSDFCKKKNWNFDLYTEKESSRGTRPVKTELMNKLRKYKYHGVVVWKIDRWARSLREIITDIDELCKKGAFFVSYTDNIDLSTSSGRMQFQILAIFAEFERNIISERTKAALQAKRNRGDSLGRPKGSKDKKKRRRRWKKRPVY